MKEGDAPTKAAAFEHANLNLHTAGGAGVFKNFNHAEAWRNIFN